MIDSKDIQLLVVIYYTKTSIKTSITWLDYNEHFFINYDILGIL